ncbi:hypothetical protein EOJ32_19845 (plasmid) [Paracoccus sp. Arc7-R13]|uniref:hypothetical protein n=1 Tax=Paracoccus sp. Arc7-R13 TaxID=2500532 RepID=UPI000FD75A27|nr:hypothetical protein [Paracoccus sp. Arc7-R13]AZY96046.1 hypothetical protein EOJ32_19845 [Paracoccus sp. Arc7-R13]
MAGLTLSQASRALGKSKSTLNRAIKTGRLSATRNEDGTFSINPAELYRAFPEPSRNTLPERPKEPDRTTVPDDLGSRISLLQQLLEREREAVADLKEDRDRWRQQATSLLANQEAAPAAPPLVKRHRWWPF